ncbi:diguanylate cyclase (GGDEF) domain-containing protein [Granulicella rosea]|uniref:Diguanylate cyclase (GGDEF) domain-containing protein n=1 Tax=Granulicella rosea TaxID=474952 RepID=A0A239LP44_9BACT|nr:GGDEF domain-containing protein [Granulicella rosea]SNT32316.1 diguanylate cyclase (GGDEF) domain-containing protein [Granulicella rosea]
MIPSIVPDYGVLTSILSLAVFLGAFRPLVRRAGPHVNLWFVGWTCMLVHYIALFLLPSTGAVHTVCSLTAVWALELCALVFMRAAGNGPITRVGWVLTAEIAVPVLLQSALSVLRGAGNRPAMLVFGLLLIPITHLVLHKAYKSRPYASAAMAAAVLTLYYLGLHGATPEEITDGVLAILFLSAAYLYSSHARRVSRAVLCAVTGLAGWGITFLIAAAFHRFAPEVHLNRTVMSMPQYLVVAAIILNLLEEHMLHTERMAMHDALTGLPNRRLFEGRFADAMADSRRLGAPIACLVIDVDNFKFINDTMGHYTGDELLKALATRLSWHMGPADMLARTGGDEFTALLAGVRDEYHLRFIASAMMSAASVPLEIDGVSVEFHISVGIAVSPADADDVQGLRRAADDAMYRAKRQGGSLLAFAGDPDPELESDGPLPFRL